MTIRFPFDAPVLQPVFETMKAFKPAIAAAGLPKPLLELVKTRASLLNHCAYCVDMHTKDARAHNETEQRLYLLSAWRKSPQYTAQERAALAWTDALTELDDQPTDALYDEVRAHFSEQQFMALTLAIVEINSWNRIVIATQPEVGSYRPRQ